MRTANPVRYFANRTWHACDVTSNQRPSSHVSSHITGLPVRSSQITKPRFWLLGHSNYQIGDTHYQIWTLCSQLHLGLPDFLRQNTGNFCLTVTFVKDDICVSYYTMRRGVATGVYRYIYPQKISNRFVHVWDINTCFEIAMTKRIGLLPKSNSWLCQWLRAD